jgi:hypothetical protein
VNTKDQSLNERIARSYSIAGSCVFQVHGVIRG